MKNKKNALITGVTRNIGRAICKKYAENGYNIIGTYRTGLDDPKELQQFKDEFPDSDLYKVDFCDSSDLTKFISHIKNNNIMIDVLVNNAGMFNVTEHGVRNEFLDFDLEAFSNVMNCNFLATTRLSIELKDNIRESGNIIIISSGASHHGAYASISYNASKAALINLCESLAANYYRYRKVRVNAISPGWVDSEGGTMGADKASTFMGRVAAVTPMGRNGTPEEVANMVYLITSDAASFTTGANIAVDGGYNIHNVNYLEEAEYARFSIEVL